MKIYNGTDSLLDLPLVGSQRLTIKPHSASENFVCTTDLINLLTQSYETKEIAFIVGGHPELNLCAQIPVAINYIVQSMDEAVERFELNKKKVEDIIPNTDPEPIVEEKEEEVIPNEEEAIEENVPCEENLVEEEVTEDKEAENQKPVVRTIKKRRTTKKN